MLQKTIFLALSCYTYEEKNEIPTTEMYNEQTKILKTNFFTELITNFLKSAMLYH